MRAGLSARPPAARFPSQVCTPVHAVFFVGMYGAGKYRRYRLLSLRVTGPYAGFWVDLQSLPSPRHAGVWQAGSQTPSPTIRTLGQPLFTHATCACARGGVGGGEHPMSLVNPALLCRPPVP